VIAYENDVNIIVTKTEDIAFIKVILHDHAEATGVTVNTQKSKALALGRWNKSGPVMDI
jgi:hypothetical protein